MSTTTREGHVLTAQHAWAIGHGHHAMDWCTDHGIDPRKVYRVEMYARLGGQRLARIYEFEWDEQGRMAVRDGRAARREPYIVTVKSPLVGVVPLLIPAGAELPEPSA